MNAKELFDGGNLSGAIEQVTQDVKANPRDLQSRIFLFELLCFAGEYDRARRQLDAVAQTSDDVKVEMGAQLYRSALQAEMARREFFNGTNRMPKFFSEPPAYAVLHVDAARKLNQNQVDEAETLLKASAGARPAIKGRADARPFADFCDGDDLLGPFLEVFFQGDYYWLPFEQIQRIELQSPRTLRDLIWTPVAVQFGERPRCDVFVPALYCGSHQHPDDLVKLGRMTEWKSLGSEFLLGLGQRTFMADDEERPLLEIRTVEFSIQP